MPSASDFYDEFSAGLIAVPAIQPGICPVCRTATKPGYDLCYVCSGHPDVRVLPITMSLEQGMIHSHLRGYKDRPSAEARQVMTVRIAALVRLFLDQHESCLGEWDSVATVPSTRSGRNAPSAILRMIGQFHTEEFLVGVTEQREVRGLELLRSVEGKRVLIFDDTFTTGRSVFAVVDLIEDAGGEVVGPLVVGRHINPSFTPSQTLLTRLPMGPLDLSRCARCSGVEIIPPLRPNHLF